MNEPFAPSGSAHGAGAVGDVPPPPGEDPLLDAALAFVERHGWENATSERLAFELNLPIEQVSRRFPDRAYIGEAALRRVLERLPAEFADDVDEHSTLRDQLYAIVSHELRSMTNYRRCMLGLMRASANPLSRSAALQTPLVAAYLGFIAQQVQKARLRREISPWVVPGVAVSAFWLVHLRIVSFWLNDTSEASQATHAQADRWITQFTTALGARPPTPGQVG